MDIKDFLYEAHDDKVGIMRNNEQELVTHILGTDLTVVHNRQEERTYVLVPLTKNHSFEYHGTWLKVDGKTVHSEYYYQKDGCQWIEVNSLTIAEVV